jgi:hypothetical protein
LAFRGEDSLNVSFSGNLLAADAGNASAWITLLAALGGVVVTGIIGLVTASLSQRWQARNSSRLFVQDQLKQLRQERREFYAAYWSAWNRLIHEMRRLERSVADLRPTPSTAEEARRLLNSEVVDALLVAELEWREAGNVVFLVSGQSVFDAASAHKQATERRLRAAWNGTWAEGQGTYLRLNSEMRRELIEPSTAPFKKVWNGLTDRS